MSSLFSAFIQEQLTGRDVRMRQRQVRSGKMRIVKALPENLHEFFIYDAEEGLLWRERPTSHFKVSSLAASWNEKHAGKLAGAISGKGYRTVKVGRHTYQVSRIVVYIQTGFDIRHPIKHKNGIHSDCIIENLDYGK